jgi:hypothetical protein
MLHMMRLVAVLTICSVIFHSISNIGMLLTYVPVNDVLYSCECSCGWRSSARFSSLTLTVQLNSCCNLFRMRKMPSTQRDSEVEWLIQVALMEQKGCMCSVIHTLTQVKTCLLHMG